MHSGVIFISILTLICWVIQLLPVISVPITASDARYRIELSNYKNTSFGVFGFCQLQYDSCSEPTIGYVGDVVFPYVPDEFQSGNPITVFLPNKAMQAFSKLLFVHVIAFVFSSFLLLTTLFCLLHEHFYLPNTKSENKKNNETSPPVDEDTIYYNLQKRRRIFTIYFELMLALSILCFLLALLGFLADILLFNVGLGWVGWIQLAGVLIMALISSLLCFMRRSILSRRHLEEEVYALRRVPSTLSDSASDLSVYIYTNGFVTARDEQRSRNNESRDAVERIEEQTQEIEFNDVNENNDDEEIIHNDTTISILSGHTRR